MSGTPKCINCHHPDRPTTMRHWCRGPGEPMQLAPVCNGCVEATKQIDRKRRKVLVAKGIIRPLSARPTLRLRPGEREAFEALARPDRAMRLAS